MTEDFNPTEWMTDKGAAKVTGYTAAYFRQLIARDRLQGRKIGRYWVLDKSEVLDYAEEMKPRG
jgi:excisionase family DNA binding protein